MFRKPIKIEILNNTINLDVECWNCGGGKTKPNSPFIKEDGNCERCNGTGYELTDNGQAILDLINRHMNGDINV